MARSMRVRVVRGRLLLEIEGEPSRIVGRVDSFERGAITARQFDDLRDRIRAELEKEIPCRK